MQASPGTLVEESFWRDILNAELPSSLYEVYTNEAPLGIDRKVIELGYWLGVEPEAFKQRVKR